MRRSIVLASCTALALSNLALGQLSLFGQPQLDQATSNQMKTPWGIAFLFDGSVFASATTPNWIVPSSAATLRYRSTRPCSRSTGTRSRCSSRTASPRRSGRCARCPTRLTSIGEETP